jgi:hypothetical protein
MSITGIRAKVTCQSLTRYVLLVPLGWHGPLLNRELQCYSCLASEGTAASCSRYKDCQASDWPSLTEQCTLTQHQQLTSMTLLNQKHTSSSAEMLGLLTLSKALQQKFLKQSKLYHALMCAVQHKVPICHTQPPRASTQTNAVSFLK